MFLCPSCAATAAMSTPFALPLSKFAACLTPDISGEDAAGIIGQVYAAEAKAREESKPTPVVKPAEPRPDPFIEQEEGFPLPWPPPAQCGRLWPVPSGGFLRTPACTRR